MKHATSRQIAFYIAGLTFLGAFVLVLITGYVLADRLAFGLSALVSGVLGLFTYYVANQFVERFIYRKIKLVYKTIHQLKVRTQSEGLRKRIRMGSDVIGEVNDEVLEWAKNKKEEIEELKKLETYRRDFIGNLSHELKTPIFNIQGYVTTLIEGGSEDKEILDKYLSNTEKNVERMISLVDDLDTIYKLESGRIHMEFEKFDIIQLSREVADMLEINAQQRGVTIIYKDEYRTPIWVSADKNSIKQVMTNLILNSIVYGKEQGTTKLSFYDMDENILIEVADDGPGIEEKHLPRLFERFYRVDKSRSRHQGGTGLGLSIVKHIIEAHHQTINVRSTVGHGSTFAFTLRKYR